MRNSECCSFTKDRAFRIGAIHNAPPAFAEAMARRELLMRPTPQHPFRRMVTTKEVVQIADLTESPAYKVRDPGVVMLVELASARTFLAVPMLKENEVVGVIAIYRQEVRAFTDKQIAVWSELRQSGRHRNREHSAAQRAARIAAAADRHGRRAQGDQSFDRFELQPVFDTILRMLSGYARRRVRLSVAVRRQGAYGRQRYNTSPELKEFIDTEPSRSRRRHSAAARAALERQTVAHS